MFRIITFDPRYRSEFKELNLEWIQAHFKVEQKDEEQLGNPEETISGGGEVFFVLTDDGEAVATCAMIKMDDGGYELAKMAVRPD